MTLRKNTRKIKGNPLKDFQKSANIQPKKTDITFENFESKLGHFLNFCQSTYDAKDSKKFLIEFFPSYAKKIRKLSENDFFNFISLGYSCKFLKNNNLTIDDIEEKYKKWINIKLEEITTLSEIEHLIENGTEPQPKKERNVQKAILNQVNEKMGEIDQFVDDFIYERKSNFNIIEYVKDSKFSNIHIRKIINILKEQQDKYIELEEYEELPEEYGFLTDSKIEKIINFYDKIINGLEQFIVYKKSKK